MSLFETAVSPDASLLRPAAGDFLAPVSDRRYAVTWSRQATVLALASVLGFVAVAYGCWQVTGSVVPWDSKNHFYPMFRFLADALHNGEIPIWNPYHFGGHPAIADPQSLIFTPTMVLFALVAPHASMQLFDAVILAHVAGGSLGILGLFARRGWHPAGAVLAALIFVLGGAASSRLQHTGMIISYSFFPLALWTLEVALARRSYGFAALFGLLGALMVLGRDQVAFLSAIVLIGSVLWTAAASREPVAYLRARFGLLVLAGGIISAILVVPVLLTMQFLGTSNRPEEAFGVAAAGSLAPVNLMTLIAPNFFGSLNAGSDYWGPGSDTISAADWTDRCVNYLFIGTLPILLILWHGLAGGRLFGRGARFAVIVCVAAFLYALGRYTPIFGLAFDWLPGVSLYRRPADATFILNIGLAFASGFLLHRFIRDGLPRPFRQLRPQVALCLLGFVTLGVAVLVGNSLAFTVNQGHVTASLIPLGVAAGLTLGFAALLVAFASPQRRVIGAIVVVALTGGELLWRNADSTMNAEPVSYYDVYATMTPTETEALSVLRRELATKQAEGEYPRVEILGLSGAWQNASMLLKFENTLGYNPLRIADYERAVGPGENAGDPNLRHFPGTFRGYRCKLATLLGLEYLVLDRPLSKLPRHFPRPVATLLYSGDSLYVYKLGKTAPRTYFASEIKPVDSNAVLSAHTLPDFDRTSQALIDQRSVSDLNLDAPHPDVEVSPGKGQSTIRSYSDNAVSIDVDADRAGVVVLHDLYYPGWEVRVDGVQKPVLRANILFRGVEVPAGQHRVEFTFRPLSLANLTAAAEGLLHRGED